MAHPDPDRLARLSSEVMPLPDDEMKAAVMEMLESGEPTEADVLAIKAMAEQRVHEQAARRDLHRATRTDRQGAAQHLG